MSLSFFEHMKIRKTFGTENLLTRKQTTNAKWNKDLLKQTYHPKLSDTFWSGSTDGYQLQKSKKWGETDQNSLRLATRFQENDMRNFFNPRFKE